MSLTPVSPTSRLLLALAGAVVSVALVQAQQPQPGGFRMPPQQQIASQPAAQTQVTGGQQPTIYPMGNFNYNPYMYGGFGTPGFFGGYYPGRVGGALQGVAAVTTANAQYQGIIQDARLQQSYANQSHLDYRRKAIQEWQYEQSLKQSPEDIKAQEDAQSLRRARENPTNTEIWSATSLNDLFKSVKVMQAGGLRGPLVPLSPDVVRHINLTDGTTGGSVGLFRDGGGDLPWPLVLKTSQFDEDRKKIDQLALVTVQQARSGRIADQTMFDLIAASDRLRAKIDAAVQTLSPTAWVQASRFANELKSTIKALQDPNVGRMFNGQWVAQGNNVGEVLGNMIQKGLRFAPAAPGDESFYTSFYQSMLSYDMGLNQVAYRGPSGSPPR